MPEAMPELFISEKDLMELSQRLLIATRNFLDKDGLRVLFNAVPLTERKEGVLELSPPARMMLEEQTLAALTVFALAQVKVRRG